MDLSPKYKSEKFQCPHCHVVSQQDWFNVDNLSDSANRIIDRVLLENEENNIDHYEQQLISAIISEVKSAYNYRIRDFVPEGFSVTTCLACHEVCLWVKQEIVYPKHTLVEPPNKDMDQEIQDLYLEASTIVVDSPKGATALLRLALQLLLKQLGKSGANVNKDIKELVAEGLSPHIQKALDLLRVVGNNAVHPGLIDLEDGRDIPIKLFKVLNFIANEMISKPKELESLYADIVPEETQQHIRERDGKL